MSSGKSFVLALHNPSWALVTLATLRTIYINELFEMGFHIWPRGHLNRVNTFKQYAYLYNSIHNYISA